MKDELVMWTVYDHPHDFPHCFVARKWIIKKGEPMATSDIIVTPLLEDIRDMMAQIGLTPVLRSPNDDPKVVETWI